jgi:hypothetical protein
MRNPDPSLLPIIEIAAYPAKHIIKAIQAKELVIGRLTTPTSNPYWDMIYSTGRTSTVVWTIWYFPMFPKSHPASGELSLWDCQYTK